MQLNVLLPNCDFKINVCCDKLKDYAFLLIYSLSYCSTIYNKPLKT